MHPVHHALSSARTFGGNYRAYLAVHELIDSSKAATATAQHRAMLHSHDFGLALVCAICPPVDTPGAQPSITDIATQHLLEDLRGRPKLDDWLACLNADDLPHALPDSALSRSQLDFRHSPLAAAADLWGGTANDYASVLNLLHSADNFSDHPFRHRLLASSFGIFLIERCLGPTLLQHPHPTVPTRPVAEKFIDGLLGFIPATAHVLEAIELQSWMRGLPPQPSYPDAPEPALVPSPQRAVPLTQFEQISV